MTIKIEQATVFGFGKWVDYTIDFSTDKLVCIYGYNESGKSTLQQFILFMLFGFPPKKRQFYRPKTSGKMGGRLVIVDQKVGTFTIERLDEVKNGAATCFLPDGVTRDETWLKERLQGMTSTAFQSIFLFSALDLQHIKTMNNTELGEVLLGTGLTGAHNIYSVEKQLDQKLGELFKPFGKNPQINQQLELLDTLQLELVNSGSNQATYHHKITVAKELSDEIHVLQTTMKQKNKSSLNIKKQLDNLSLIMDYHQHIKKLKEYTEPIQFPEEGIDRLQNLNNKLLPLKSEQVILKANLEKQHNKLVDLNHKKLPVGLLQKIENVLSKQKLYESNRKLCKRIHTETDQLMSQLNSELSSLNLNIDQATLTNLKLPFHIERSWHDLKNETEQIKYEKEQLQQQYATIHRQIGILEANINDTQAKLLSDERKNKLQNIMQTHETHEVTTQLRKQNDAHYKRWERQKLKKQKRNRIVLVSSLILSGLLGMYGWIFTTPIMYQMMIVLFVFGLFQWFLGKQTIKETNHLMSQEEYLNSPTQQITKEEQQVAAQELSDHEETKNNLAALQTQLKTLNIQQLQWQEKNIMIEQREQRLEQKSNGHIETYPFLHDLEVAYWSEFYHTLKHLMGLQQKITENQQEIKQLHEQIYLFEEHVREAAIRVDHSLKKHSCQFHLEKLENIIAENKNVQQQMHQIQQTIEEDTIEQTKLEQKMRIYQNELQLLFQTASVTSENEFYSRAKQLQEQETINRSLQKIIKHIQTVFPQETCEHIMQEQPNQNDLHISYQQLQADIHNTEMELEEKRQQLADAKAQLKQLESSESYSELNHRMMMEKEQLQQMANKWAIQKVAKEMLVEAKRVYQEKYLATTIEKTAKYFKRLTHHAYVAIYPPTDHKPFQVETADHMRFNIEELSQGTIDQLYICLRLAIGEVMSEKHKLPFIIDDAFVHFDQRRTRQMIDILEQIGLNRQVILFTCKKEITQMLSRDKVIELRGASSQLV